jgi:High potential iron-sulfur protein
MNEPRNPGRRALLQQAALGLSLAPLALALAPSAAAGALPLISEQDPAAKAVHYVEDASRAKGAASGADCSSCSLYGAAAGATQGTCTLFPGKLVKAAGWCSSWSGL